MIKIRYRHPNELSPGLHAAAERDGRSTVVYLLCGLTAQERRAALRRLRLSARMGYCPALPAAQLALALVVDRVTTGVGQAGAVFRLHPAGSTLPVMVVSAGAIAFLLFSTVSIRVLHVPRTYDPLQVAGAPPVASADAVPAPTGSPSQPAGPRQLRSDNGRLSPAGPASSVSNVNHVPAVLGSPAAGPDSPTPTPAPSASASSGSSAAAPQPASATTAPASTAPATVPSTRGAGPAPSSAAQPEPTASDNPGGALCADVGPLGVCLNM